MCCKLPWGNLSQQGNIFLNNVETARSTIVTADKVPYDIMTIFKFEETEDELILHKGKLVFNVDEDDEVEFLEKYDQSVESIRLQRTIKGFDFKKNSLMEQLFNEEYCVIPEQGNVAQESICLQ